MSRMIHLTGYSPRRNTRQSNGSDLHSDYSKEFSYASAAEDHPKVDKLIYDRNDFILVKNEHKMINLQVKDLIYIEGKGNYVSIHSTKSRILTLQTMRNLESILAPYLFVRVHKSYLVSFHHVEAIDNNTIWIGNEHIPLGDSYRESFRSFLNANTRQL